MLQILVLLSAFLFLGEQAAYCQDFSVLQTDSSCQCVISQTTRNHKQFRLDFNILNNTQFQKLDFQSDIHVIVSDLYENSYKAIENGKSFPAGFSVYPGQMHTLSYDFEQPVSGVENFVLHVFSGQEEVCQVPFQAKDQDSALSPDSDDIIVVYPKIFKTYHPGDKVFIELDFSKRAGKPDRLHILLDGRVFTDLNSQGRYEVNIPEKDVSGGLEIIVIGEWTQDASAPATASKTIHIDVADNGVS